MFFPFLWTCTVETFVRREERQKKSSEDESLCNPTKRLFKPGRESELRLNSNLGAEKPGGLPHTQTPWSVERPPFQVSQISVQGLIFWKSSSPRVMAWIINLFANKYLHRRPHFFVGRRRAE
uniref:Uncharacterized protein n=1 Tax=Salix viminalis TaxID=40686 RepID=A0A6N2MTT8_SALVM